MIKSVRAGKEIVVLAQNRVGVLYEIAQTLASGKVNVRALCAQASGGVGLVNIMVDQPGLAGKLLMKRGFRIYENKVTLVEIEDKAGALMKVTKKLAEHKIDLNNVYATVAGDYPSGTCSLVISSNNADKALAVLRQELKSR